MKAEASGLRFLFEPPRASGPRAAHPATLVLLHGRGADEKDLLALAPSLDVRLGIYSVRAPRPFPGGGFTWYDTEAIGRPKADQFAESFAALQRFLEEVAPEAPRDSRIFLLGFSMGAVMAHVSALARPERVAGVVAHSGYIPAEADTGVRFAREHLRGRPWFVAHGVEDPLLPPRFGRESRDLLSTLEVELTYREYPIGHWISAESLADLSNWLSKKLDEEEEIP